jgi:hypothetical protein
MTLTATQRQRAKDPDFQINYKQTFKKISWVKLGFAPRFVEATFKKFDFEKVGRSLNWFLNTGIG